MSPPMCSFSQARSFDWYQTGSYTEWQSKEGVGYTVVKEASPSEPYYLIIDPQYYTV